MKRLVIGCALLLPSEGMAQRVTGRVVDPLGAPVAAVEVVTASGFIALTDASGFFAVPVPGGDSAVSVALSRIGFTALDTVMSVRRAHTIALREAPVDLQGLTVVPQGDGRGLGGRRPTLTEFRRDNLRAVPDLAEADLLRVLQVAPGVSAANELNAELHVRGSPGDQTPVYLGQARIFAPFHLLGLMGSVNPDAIESIRLDRALPPVDRLASTAGMIELVPDAGPDSTFASAVALGLISARATAGDALSDGRGRWRLAARQSHFDVIAPLIGRESGSDFLFTDLNGAAEWSTGARSRLEMALFWSRDDMRGAFGGDRSLESGWENRVASLAWRHATERVSVSLGTGWSSYAGFVSLGENDGVETSSEAEDATFRADVRVMTNRAEARAGLVASAQRAAIDGGEEGALVEGDRAERPWLLAPYAEVAVPWRGGPELTAGLRGVVTDGSGWIEPRARLLLPAAGPLGEVYVAARSSRQVLSTLVDQRYVLPGASMWYGHTQLPAERREVSIGLRRAWISGWRLEVGAYSAQLRNVLSWRPESRRTLDQVEFVDGRSLGAEVLAELHGDAWDAWIAYTLATVTLEGSDAEYHPVWDRRHSFSGMLSRRVRSNVLVSLRVEASSGAPVYPVMGTTWALDLQPFVGNVGIEGTSPLFGEAQITTPMFFRADAGARARWQWWGHEFGMSAGLLNLTGRNNPLMYEAATSGQPGSHRYELRPVGASAIRIFPSLEIDVSF